MPRWLAWTLGALFVLLLVLHAHGPLIQACGSGAGFSESDLRALLGVGDCLHENRPRFELEPYLEAEECGLRPLGALSVAISSALWSNQGAFGASSPLPLRIENLILFALVAAGAGVFLRRLVSPWLGDEHARAAAWVAAVLCLVHPIAYAAVVSIAARGDLIALALGTWSGAQFLRARQSRTPRAAVRAGVGTLLASLASPLAWAIPFALAASEFCSGRRYRALAARARTTLVTLAVYGLCAAVEPIVRAVLDPGVAGLDIERPAVESAALALEKLGVLVLPVNPASLSFAAYLLAAGLLVVALEPAFSAARSAPRLWSLILAAGAAAILCASFAGRDVRVQPADFTRAEVLLAGLIVVSSGLALASTALTGLRRALMPAILASGWAAIAHVHAGAWVQSIEAVDRARGEVARVLSQDPAPAAIFLLDVPAFVRGVAPLDRTRAQSFLAAPQFLARDKGELALLRARLSRPVMVAAPTDSAFVQFARTNRFEELRGAGIALAIDASKPGERFCFRLPVPSPTSGQRRWFREGSSIALDWESLSIRSVTARGPRDTDLARAPSLGWSASGEGLHFKGGAIEGVWIDLAGEPLACFDVAATLDWLCAGRVQLVWPVGGWSNLSEADAADQLSKFDLEPSPVVRDDDWIVATPPSPLVDAAAATLARRGQSGRWRLALCDLETLEQESFEWTPLEGDPPGRLVAAGAGRVASQWSARGNSLAWSIEYIAAGVVLVRSDGLVLPPAVKDQ